ncbi:MAG: sigma-70 family RNA polymerase sigma factor [Gemmatimonadetes bacterium]|nr:sigma-70 family RNA polymerase sigma factor [Gemmatimonadota bacterium]
MKTDTPSKPQATEAPARPRDPRGSRSDLPHDFDAWFREHRESVYRYVRFRVATRELAEDITSDVFLKALRSLHGYDRRRAAPRTWLLRIARNAVTDHLRSLRRRRSLQVSLDRVPDLVSQAPSQEERILREEQVSRLLNAAATLRAADQEVLSLRYGAGLANAEIADAFGTSSNVVAVRMHRALARLKAAVEAPRSQREER